MKLSTQSPLIVQLKEIADSEHRIHESLTHLQLSTQNYRVKDVLEAQVERTAHHLEQITGAFESLGIEPSRKQITPSERALHKSLDWLKKHQNAPDFEDCLVQAMGRISQLQVKRYAQATVMALEAGEHVLSALLQDILDDYSRLTRRLTRQANLRAIREEAAAPARKVQAA
jgi:ferritin-like metal-binding protein YciE